MRNSLAILSVLTALVLATPARAQSQAVGVAKTPMGYQQITSLSSAASLTVPAGAKIAVIQAEAQAVRYRDDGTDPSSTVGMPIASGAWIVYTAALSRVRLIEQAATAKVNVLYYK